MANGKTSANYAKKEIRCSNGECDIWTCIVTPKSFTDFTGFICGFCSAKELLKLKQALEEQSKSTTVSYAEITKNFKDTSVCAALADEVKTEEKRQKAKSANLVFHGVKPPTDKSDVNLVHEISGKLSVELSPSDFSVKRVPPKEGQKRNLLIVSFNDTVKRLALLRKAKKLREFSEYAGIFINPDLTRAEQQKQFELRQELREKRASQPDKAWIIRNDRVICASSDK